MRNVRAWLALTGIMVSVALSMATAGFQFENPAWSAVLDGFSINTQDKAVTVTLYTDQRVPYTTETQGHQYTIVLPNAQLAPSLEEGLPVVIDNKNRFIGRAMPTEDGQVKIILPNLPADEYAVSIQQKQAVAKTSNSSVDAKSSVANKPAKVATASPPTIKPRPAVLETDEQAFERITARFQQKKSAQRSQRSVASSGLRLSPAKVTSSSNAAGNPIWNPYVVRNQPAQETASESQPVAQNPGITLKPTSEPVSTVSVADSLMRSNSRQQQDPFWYLHALPPANPNLMVADDMQGLAKAVAPETAKEQTPAVVQQLQPAPIHLATELKSMLKALPKWLWLALGVFLCGLGLFGLIGAVVLLKILFVQAQPMQTLQPAYVVPDTSPMVMPSVQPVQPTSVNSPARPIRSTPKAYATPPRQVIFQDTTSVNALDYLKGSSRSVSEAVQNSALLKFPHTSRKPKASDKPASLRTR